MHNFENHIYKKKKKKGTGYMRELSHIYIYIIKKGLCTKALSIRLERQ